MTLKRTNIGVVDYGMGNLHSVAKAFSTRGGTVSVSKNKQKLTSSDILLLPGVGSFGAAMKNLGKHKLDDFICDWVEAGKPYIGICLGLQLLFERSEEDPGVSGLGILKGRVAKFRMTDFKKKEYRVPHMGWNTVKRIQERGSEIFQGISELDSFYFVHTYYPVPRSDSVICTKTDYGKPFCSSVRTKSIFASQFHPEKSGEVGLKLISNLIKTMPKAA